MSKLRGTTLVVALFSAVLFASAAAAIPFNTYYVNVNTGSDANDGRSTGTPFKTIGFAMNAAVSADVINVAPGTYVWAAPPC